MKLLTVFSVTLVCILSLQSCSNNKFQGYVYDGDQPLDSVLVTGNRGDSTYTDSLGYFVLRKNKKRSNMYFLFKKKGYKTDTVRRFYYTGSIKSKEMFKTKEDTVHLSIIEKKIDE